MATHSTPAHIDEAEADEPTLSPIDAGRLGVYAALGATVGTVPLPWVPDALARRVRGALVHDVAVRHGLSLSHEARETLASPSGLDESKGVLVRTVRQFGLRLALRALTRVGPVGVIWPLGHAVRTYALGHLFDRYLARDRTEDGVRIEENEARRVRHAIDGALKRALSVSTTPLTELTAVDDQRDSTTALVDGVLAGAAGVPARLVARLDAAFDDLYAHADG